MGMRFFTSFRMTTHAIFIISARYSFSKVKCKNYFKYDLVYNPKGNIMSYRAAINRFTDENLREKIRDSLEWINWKDRIYPDSRLYIKPNLTFPEYREGVTTSPKFMAAVLDVLKERTPHLTVFEGDGGNNSYPADKAFATHDLYEICGSRDVRLINITNMEKVEIDVPVGGGKTIKLPQSKEIIENADMTISVPVPKMHFVARYTGAIKNHWGTVPDSMRLRNHYFFKHAINAIIRELKSEITIVDGEYFLDVNGPVVGTPVKLNIVMAADNPYVADTALMDIMGVDPGRIGYIDQAVKLGKMPSGIGDIEFNTDLSEFKTHKFSYKRDPVDYLALVGFHSKLVTYIVYLSPLHDIAHSAVKLLRGGSRQVDEYYSGIVDEKHSPNEPG